MTQDEFSKSSAHLTCPRNAGADHRLYHAADVRQVRQANDMYKVM